MIVKDNVIPTIIDVIDYMEIFTVGRQNKSQVNMTVAELQKQINIRQEPPPTEVGACIGA